MTETDACHEIRAVDGLDPQGEDCLVSPQTQSSCAIVRHLRRVLPLALTLPFVLVPVVVEAARPWPPPILVADVNATAPGASSNPQFLACTASQCFFVANDGEHGSELWRTDGTTGGTRLVFDIRPGAFSGLAAISMVGVLDEVLLFNAFDEANGSELWRSDGTAAGTTMVRDIATGSASSSPAGGISDGQRVLFTAQEQDHGRELWITDGTPNGTHLVRDLTPGGESSTIDGWAVLDGWFYVLANGALWRTDGSDAGSVQIVPDAGFAVFSVGRQLLLLQYVNASRTTEIWRSDGTAAGTVLVQGGFPNRIERPFVAAAALYFRTDDGAHGSEPWISDGTAVGTRMVDDLNPGAEGSYPEPYAVLDSQLVFAANTPETGTELWRTDGTPAGTTLVADIVPGPGSSDPYGPCVAASALFFVATDGVHGAELWATAGSAETTSRVTDLAAGPAASIEVASAAVFRDLLLFRATDGLSGQELWSVPARLPSPRVRLRIRPRP